jgi:hypothetical protein
VYSVINVSTVGQAGFVGASGLGAGGNASFALAWMTNGNGLVWGNTNALNGNTNLSVSNTPRGVAAMVGLSPVSTNPWVVVVRDDGSQEAVIGVIPGARITSTRVVAVASGKEHGLSLCADGRVMAWGQDPYGEGKTNGPGTLSNAVGVAAGNAHSAAICKDGTVVAWGSPNNNATAVPQELTNRGASNFVRAVAVVAAGEHNLVLRADGSLRWWGPNNSILNPGHSINTGLQLESPTNPVVALGLSMTPHAAAVRRNGQVVVWGTTTLSLLIARSRRREQDGTQESFASMREHPLGSGPSAAADRHTHTPQNHDRDRQVPHIRRQRRALISDLS